MISAYLKFQSMNRIRSNENPGVKQSWETMLFKQKVLFVDNDSDVLQPLQTHLEKQGFETAQVANGENAISYLSNEIPEIIVLEITLPGLDGIETCHHIRESLDLENTLIVFLTNRREDYSQIAAYQAGADDFITKPINPRVFSTRIAGLLNRSKRAPQRSQIKPVGLEIDEEKMLVSKDGEITHWQNIEFEILRLLNSEPGRIFSRGEIYRSIWPEDKNINERRVDVYVRKIREKIGQEHILTIFGRGYKFVK